MSLDISKLFKKTEANKIHNVIGESKGEAKNRFNISKALLKEDYKSEKDLTNQFFIATEGDALHITSDKNWTAGFGKVAVLLKAEEMDGKDTQYSYVILNIESLGKRLLMNRSKLRQLEGNAEDLKKVVTNRLKDLMEEEKKMTDALAFIEEGFFPEGEENYDSYREKLAEFIGQHFKDDPYLMEGLPIFKNNMNGMMNDSTYLNHLKKKLWWRIGDTQLEKVAITPNNLPNVYYRNVDEKRAVLNLLPETLNQKDRYSLELKHDFIYSERPKKVKKDEVPIYVGSGWVIVNSRDLACLGISVKEARNWSKITHKGAESKLDNQIFLRINEVKKFNNKVYEYKANMSYLLEKLNSKETQEREINFFDQTEKSRSLFASLSSVYPDPDVQLKLKSSPFLFSRGKTIDEEIKNFDRLIKELLKMGAILELNKFYLIESS